ncbi:hypothetical protein ACX0MV_20130 [Pseudomonas borbori]
MKKLGFLMAIFLSGCAGIYEQPTETEPHAKLTVEFAQNELPQGGAQLFYAYNNDNCEANHGAAIAGLSWSSESSKVVRLYPGSKIYIQAATVGITGENQVCGTSYCMLQQRCVNVISFTPEAGVSYTMKHHSNNKSCSIFLINSTSQTPPSSIEIHPVKNGCKI